MRRMKLQTRRLTLYAATDGRVQLLRIARGEGA